MYSFKRSKKAINTDKTKPDGRCKRHPKHRQSPGVCAICLRERLIQLSPNSLGHREISKTTVPSSSSCSSLSSCYSSCSQSSCSSPVHGSYRFTLEGKGSLSSLLTKSKSVAFVGTRRRRIEDVGHDKEKRKKGFWTYFLSGYKASRNQGSLMYSRTVIERNARY